MKKIILKKNNNILLSYYPEDVFDEFNRLLYFIKDKKKSEVFQPDMYIYELLDSDNRLIEKTFWFKF